MMVKVQDPLYKSLLLRLLQLSIQSTYLVSAGGYRVCAIARSFRGRRRNWQGRARSVKDSFDRLHMQERVCLFFAAIRVVVEAWLVEGGCVTILVGCAGSWGAQLWWNTLSHCRLLLEKAGLLFVNQKTKVTSQVSCKRGLSMFHSLSIRVSQLD